MSGSLPLPYFPMEDHMERHKRIRGGKYPNQKVEDILSTPYQYIQCLASLPFRVLHLPLGALPAHVDAMVTANYIKQENIFQIDPDGNIIGNYTKSKDIPQVFQYQIQNDEQLANIITDRLELERIRKEALEKGLRDTYPTISLMNPPALIKWAKYMGKRLPKNHKEQISIYNKLPGKNVKERLSAGGIPFFGYFDANTSQLSTGRQAILMVHTPYGDGFDTVLFDHDKRGFDTGWIISDGASALLLEDL